jgi:hypothetical protein
MNRFIFRLRSLQIGRALMACLAGLILFAGATLGQFVQALPATAATLTPEEISTEQAERRAMRSEENAERAKQAEADAPQSLGDKLNIGEPVPESTKKFFKQVQGEAVETTEELSPEKRYNTVN